MLNVRDFGAVADGITDDRHAIQTALDAAAAGGDTRVYLPGTAAFYKIGGALLNNKTTAGGIAVFGDGYASEIRGDFAGYLIDRNPGVGTSGRYEIRDLLIRNIHATGGGVRLNNFVGGRLTGLVVEANWIGICADKATFTLSVDNCRVKAHAGGFPGGSIGIASGGHCKIELCDVVGLDEGIRAWGVTVNINSCRIERNRTGMRLGRNLSASSWLLSRSLIAGNSFEANDIGMDVDGVHSCNFAANGVMGSAAPSGQSQYGIKLRAFLTSSMSDTSAVGGFSEAAIAFTPNTTPRLARMSSVSGQNNIAGKPRWVLPNDQSELTFTQCDQL